MVDEVLLPQNVPGKRPASVGAKPRYQEEVSFQKSNSFNHGPYKPFIRRRRESSGSRPSSTRSDPPPDRTSFRKSGLSTPPLKSNRKSSEGSHDARSHRDSSSPRDSGVVLTSTSPPFKRSSLRHSMEARVGGTDILQVFEAANSPLSSPSASRQPIVRRHNSRDRDSRDSAYDSGMQGMFGSRKSATASLNLNEEMDDPFFGSYSSSDFHQSLPTSPVSPLSSNNSSTSSPVFLTELLEAPSFVAPSPTKSLIKRKISLPVTFSVNYEPPSFDRFRVGIKSSSFNQADQNNFLDSSESSPSLTEKWNKEQDWRLPEWNINPRESQFPSQETTL